MLYSSAYATHGIAGGELEDGRPRRLSDLLREGFDGFSRSQKAIARFIIDHLEEVGYLSAEELGEKGSTSSSTVVRFAQSLGFPGYPELQKAARDEYRLGATARTVVHDDQLGFSIEEDVLTRSLKTDVLSLEETISKNTMERFNRAVNALASAAQVLAVGLHEAAMVVGHAAYVLELLGIPCQWPPTARSRTWPGLARLKTGRRAARRRIPKGPLGDRRVLREGGRSRR